MIITTTNPLKSVFDPPYSEHYSHI